MKESYNKSQSTVQQLSSEKSELTSRVNLAAKLDATAISVLPMDKKGKQAKKIDKIVNLQISFHVAKNVTAAVGKKTFYIRLTRPDEEVMLKGNSGNFSFEGKSIPYSIRREIEYNGEETAVSMYWPVEESLQSGTYKLRIFADGNLIGSSQFPTLGPPVYGAYKHASDLLVYKGAVSNMTQPLFSVSRNKTELKALRLKLKGAYSIICFLIHLNYFLLHDSSTYSISQ